VLSNSKIEGFGDVLIPSWFEWRGKIGYDEEEDLDWKVKKDNVRPFLRSIRNRS